MDNPSLLSIREIQEELAKFLAALRHILDDLSKNSDSNYRDQLRSALEELQKLENEHNLHIEDDGGRRIRAFFSGDIRAFLLGSATKIGHTGEITEIEKTHTPVTENAAIPNSDVELAKKRKELRDRLLRNPEGKAVSWLPPEGNIVSWYRRDPELLQGEVAVMRQHFPQFKQGLLPDGRMYWYGTFQMDNLRPGATWTLVAIYDNNHPQNDTYGRSVKVYPIDPDLAELSQKLGPIPHTMTDLHDKLFIDLAVSPNETLSAARALGFAAKWITVFEFWLNENITTSEFAGSLTSEELS